MNMTITKFKKELKKRMGKLYDADKVDITKSPDRYYKQANIVLVVNGKLFKTKCDLYDSQFDILIPKFKEYFENGTWDESTYHILHGFSREISDPDKATSPEDIDKCYEDIELDKRFSNVFRIDDEIDNGDGDYFSVLDMFRDKISDCGLKEVPKPEKFSTQKEMIDLIKELS